MTFFQDKQVKKYFIFLVFITLSMLLSVFLLSQLHGEEIKNLLFTREQEIASTLLQRNFSPEEIVSILKETQITDQGASLIEKTGHTQEISPLFLPALKDDTFRFLMAALILWTANSLLLLAGTGYFLHLRDRLYTRAASIIEAFARGNFKQHLPESETGSLYQLFSSIDQLAASLQSKNELHRKTGAFLKDTISDISHQLKTPVAALKLYADIILQEPDNLSTVTEFAEKSLSSVSRIESLLQLLLKMARLDAGSICFDKKNCSVEALVGYALKDLGTRAAKEKKTLIIDIPPEASLLCDSGWTAEALTNLIKNALDHTSPGDCVTIRTETSSGFFRLIVSDTGEGISEEDFPHIFKRFYRSRKGISTQGFGLGLSLSRSIIEGQNGLLSAESVPGEGTAFIISFLTDL